MSDRSRSVRNSLPAFAPGIGLREILEASQDVLFGTDAWGRLVWASSAFETITGRRVDDCVGTPCASLLVPGEAPAVVRAMLRLQRRRGATYDRVLSVRRPDGDTVHVETRLWRMDTPSDSHHWVGIARRRADAVPGANAGVGANLGAAGGTAGHAGVCEEDLEPRLVEAREVARVMGDLLATLSHEIRSPMNDVMGTTNLLLQRELPAEAREGIERIRQSTQTLLARVSDTLDFSRLEAGRMPVERLDFDLRVTVDQVAGVLHGIAGAKSLVFDARVDAVVPSRLQGDPGRLRQVLLNLGSNAVKFTEQGSVNLHVERDAEDDHEVTLLFQMTDTGVGIEPDARVALFEPRAQSDATGTRQARGMGLGLALSKRLVEAMGGEMGVVSSPGQGSTFWFRQKFQKQPLTVGSPVPPGGQVALRGIRVLVADGRASDREPLASVLEAWGCDVARAADGPQALGMIRDAAGAGSPYAVAMISQHLQVLGGEELGHAVRADQALDATRLVMIADVGRPGDGGRVKAAGFVGYFMKPLDPAQLHAALAEVLQPGGEDTPAGDRPLVTRHSLAEARRGRLRLLLVDDDPVNQLVTTSALHRVGYNIEVASSGRRAIELTEHGHWDLILMDLQMPDLDGCSTTAAIRARERAAWRTPIVGLTANADYKPDRDRCLAAGMDQVLGKPIDLEILTTTVEKYTARDSRTPRLDSPSEMRRRLTVVSSQFDPPPAVPSTGAAAAPHPASRAALEALPGAPAPEIPAVPEGPAVDLEQLETVCMGLPALRTSLLHTFLGDVSVRIERLTSAFESADPRRVEFEAHGLKGMCATIGAVGCSTLFGAMEEWAREERVGDARLLLQPSIAEVRRTEEFIRRFDSILARVAA